MSMVTTLKSGVYHLLHVCHVYIRVRIKFLASYCMSFFKCFIFSCRLSCSTDSLKIYSLFMLCKNVEYTFYMWLLSSTVSITDFTMLNGSAWWITNGKGLGMKQLWVVLPFACRCKCTCGCHIDDIYSLCLMSYCILCILPGRKVAIFLDIDQQVLAASFREGNQQGVISMLTVVSRDFVQVLIPCHLHFTYLFCLNLISQLMAWH